MISFDKIDDRRKIDKFSNYILHTQGELMVHKLTQKAHNLTVEDRKRDIFVKN